ncbi:XRE family transcriptional regulator [bacterium]|nr:XRE family transcriptional regulator [bacterium]
MTTTTQTNNTDLNERFGERLRRGRTLRGLSLRGLSGEMGGLVSHAALAKYEKGLMKPDSKVLIALAKALAVRPDFFFERHGVTLSGIEFRKQAKLGKKKQEQVIEEAQEFFERYLEIERILEMKMPPMLKVDLTDRKGEALMTGAEEAAEKVRKTWKLGTGPLPNTIELLEDHGVKVKSVEAEESFNGLSGWADGSPVVVLGAWLDRDLPRKRLTVLHELGHLVMKMPEGLDKKTEEAACYRFAGAMLIPKEAFVAEFGRKRSFPNVSLQELIAMKEQWGMSINALMRRAKDLGIIVEESYRSYCIHASQSGLRKEEPGTWAGSESANRFRQLVHRASAQDLITRSKATGLLRVTLREFDEQFGKAV